MASPIILLWNRCAITAVVLCLLCPQLFATASFPRIYTKYKPGLLQQNEDEIGFDANPEKKDGIFDSGKEINYIVELKNNLDGNQTGTVGYTIMSRQNKVLAQNSISVSLDKNDSKKYRLSMPSQAPGFYKVNITVNITDYDDTIRRVFGVSPKVIKSTTPKPAGFDAFWQNTRDSLDLIPINPKITLQPGLEKDDLNCYLVEFQSWGNVTVRGWLTVSKNLKPGQKVPVWVLFPGYGGIGINPVFASSDLAVLAFNYRGQGNARDRINPAKEEYLTVDIENKYKYIMRGVIMDCIRAIDFVFTQPELDTDNIVCSGASMGGYLSLAVSSLDKRIKICSAFNPCFADYRSLTGSTDWPMKNINAYSEQRHIAMSKILDNLDYYDLKNFAYNVDCRSLIGIGLLDNLAPPYNTYTMINNIKGKYKLFVYPDKAHEVPHSIFTYFSKWSFDQFGIF